MAAELTGGFSPVQAAHRRIQVVAEQAKPKLEEVLGKEFTIFEAVTFTDRYNDMMKEDCIKIKVDGDKALLVYLEEAAVMTFPPQVNLLSYIPDAPANCELNEFIEELMKLRK